MDVCNRVVELLDSQLGQIVYRNISFVCLTFQRSQIDVNIRVLNERGHLERLVSGSLFYPRIKEVMSGTTSRVPVLEKERLGIATTKL